MSICNECNDFSLNITKVYIDDKANFLCPKCLDKHPEAKRESINQL